MGSPAHSAKLIWAFGLLGLAANAAPNSFSWSLVRSNNFSVYSQGDLTNARLSLFWFEQLRAFFAAAGLQGNSNQPVRVIGFHSEKEYEEYRLRPTADAYYVGTGSRDYIVMPALGPGKFGVAAHEYAHLVLRANGLRFPAWLNEGIAEFFSTVRITSQGCGMGAPMRTHLQTLRDRKWMPLTRLVQAAPKSFAGREESALFYAQSWALTHMLLASPGYETRFPELITALSSGVTSGPALSKVYGKSLTAIASDLETYIGNDRLAAVTAPGISIGSVQITSESLTPFAARLLLGDLLLATGELDRATALYDELAKESTRNPEVSAALGEIAWRKGDFAGAQSKWKQAMQQGISDARLCYRYADLAGDAGVSADEVRPALERALALAPDFDDARFKLALLESNASNYEAALKHLEAMHNVPPERAFGYWLALAVAQDQLGRHEASKAATKEALRFAATDQERAEARQLAYVADTELTVQFTRDAKGNPQMTTTRVARGAQSWNPFVEPQDQMRRAEGQLRSVECENGRITGIAVDTAAGPLKLGIPDPLHVLIRGATEFTCGPQSASPVTVEYAAAANPQQGAGVLRGMDVKPTPPKLIH